MVFISYSHHDLDFVGKLAARLVSSRIHIWFDRVELKVGDSLIDGIQSAISESDFLAVVLSKNSVESEWCKRELGGALMRELEEKRVVVLPLLIEDCDIPIFLTEKLYADFREDFEKGFDALREALASAEYLNSGREKELEYHHDWAFDWDLRSEHFGLTIDCVSFSEKFPFSVVTRIDISGNDAATRRYAQYAGAGLAEDGAAIIIGMLSEMLDIDKFFLYLKQGEVDEKVVEVRDTKSPITLTIRIRSRRLGEPSANDTVYHVGTVFTYLFEALKRKEPLTEGQRHELAKILLSPVK
ncbi:MAG: hypothetical protein CNCCGFBP_02463 [Fimbriimonadaceae bacterium]|nr:hypothetical protein [Fimbriimonadaceae bacterium]